MSSPKTCAVSFSAISSPASGAGPSPCGSPDGQMIGLFGQVLAPASRSRRRGSARAPRTTGISGPTSSGSSQPCGLGSSCGSRLQAAMPCDGSMEYSLTWRERVTPAGRRICALRASTRRTSDSGSGGLHGYPTPNAMTGGATSRSGDRIDEPLYGAMGKMLTGYDTPQHRDYRQSTRSKQGLVPAMARAFAGHGTPGAHDDKGAAKPGQRRGQLTEFQTPGPTSPSSPAATPGQTAARSCGVLAPALSRWLMGYQPEHLTCAPGYRSWALIQQLLAGASPLPSDIEAARCEATATR